VVVAVDDGRTVFFVRNSAVEAEMFGSEFVVLGKDMVGEVVGLGGAIKEVVEVRLDKVY